MVSDGENTSVTKELLRVATEQSLRSFLAPNAIFLAERLHSMFPSDESAYLLASAHLQAGNYSRAAAALRPATSPDNRYLYAVCAVRIGTEDSLRDAEAHLRGLRGPIDVEPPPSAKNMQDIPGGASGLYLLASICQRTGRTDEAIDLYRRALRANPTLWVAFEALASLGAGPTKVESVLGEGDDQATLDLLRAQAVSAAHVEHNTPRRRLRSLNSALRVPVGSQAPPRYQTPSNAPSSLQSNGTTLPVGPMRPSQSVSAADDNSIEVYTTPSPMASNRPLGSDQMDTSSPYVAQAPVRAGIPGVRRTTRPSVSPGTHDSGKMSRSRHDADITSKLFSTPPTADARANPSNSAMEVRVPSGRRRGSGHPSSIYNESLREKRKTNVTTGPAGKLQQDTTEGRMGGMEVIRKMAHICAALGRFQCELVVNLSDEMPLPHRHSSVVLSMRGRALLEQGDYVGAEKEYRRALEMYPTCLEGIAEYYSTVLWHMKKETELAQLAIRAQRIYPVSAAAWCVAGNCFSLQRDADTALRFFKKATSMDPYNAYAYTLCGHEHVAKEDFESALTAYRQALHIDERHYNALYGIGQVLQKQEKFELAERHFRAALLIHPRNSTLHYHLGVTLALSVTSTTSGVAQLLPALAELETAANLDAVNPVPRFERAKLLLAMNRVSDAKEQLEQLREILPKEAEVHFELCRVYRRMGDGKNAVRSIAEALNLDPKERRYKKELEALNSSLERTA